MLTARTLIVLFVLLLAGPVAVQTTYTWAGGTGSWNDPGRWSPEGVPAAGDVVHITSGTATLSGNTVVASLHLSDLGVINGTADLTITDSMIWTANNSESLGGSGTVTVAPGATLSMTGSNRDFRAGPSRNLVNAGIAEWSGSGRWGGPGQFINEGELELSHDAEQSTHFCFSSTTDAMINAEGGVIRRTGSGELVVYCPFSNHGRIEIQEGTLRMRDFSGNGGTDSGEYVVDEGAVLIFDGRRTLTETASVTGDGIVRTGGNSTQTTTINGTFAVPVIEALGGVRLDLNADATVETLLIGDQASQSSGQIGGSGTLIVTGELRWMIGQMHGTGTTIVAEGATFELDVRSAYTGLSGSRTFINEGTGWWTGTHRFSNNGGESTFINRGTLELETEWTGTYGTVFFAGTFSNEGTLIAASDTTMSFSSGFNNHGVVNVRSGTLHLGGFNWIGGTDTGTYDLWTGTRLEFTGGVRTLTQTAEIIGGGTVVIVDGSDWNEVVNHGTWKPRSKLVIASDFPAEESVLDVVLNGYTPGDGHSLLLVQGKARLSGTLRVHQGKFWPQPGDQFTVVAADEVIGTFDALELPEGFQGSVVTTDTTAVLIIDPIISNEEGPEARPRSFALHGPYPNPTNARTTISFDLARSGPVRLTVYDVLGRAVNVLVDEERAAGRYELALDGRGLAAGIYHVRMTTSHGFSATRTITLVP